MPVFIFSMGMIICLFTSAIFKKTVKDMRNQEWSSQNVLYFSMTAITLIGILFECSLLKLTITLTKFFA